jgi:hypothetical protein
MKQRDLDDIELGRRVGLHLVIENELPKVSRMEAIAYRLFNRTASKDQT